MHTHTQVVRHELLLLSNGEVRSVRELGYFGIRFGPYIALRMNVPAQKTKMIYVRYMHSQIMEEIRELRRWKSFLFNDEEK